MSSGNWGFYPFSEVSEYTIEPDFMWFYSGTLQTGDDNKIPVLTKSRNVFISKLEVNLYTAATGQSVIIKFYKNSILLGTVTVSAGALTNYTNIPKTFVSAGDKMTVAITQVGSVLYGITMSAFARVAA